MGLMAWATLTRMFELCILEQNAAAKAVNFLLQDAIY